MKKLFAICCLLVAICYLVWPAPEFPDPPPGSLQSNEFADTESFYRRGYFTNLSRQEIIDYYENSFKNIIQYRLNYPPEEAQTIIRDQTQSSYLEEIVHPGRESLFINAFVPIQAKDQINRNGIHYLNKITVRYIPSQAVTRLTVLLMTVLVFWWIVKEYDWI